MISQKCPKCLSQRVRRGYRPTPLWSKVLFRYNLLCDNCNWEFVGFAVPGTVSAKPTKNPKKKQTNKSIETLEIPDSDNSASSLKNEPEKESEKESVSSTGKEPEKEVSEPLVASENLADQNVKAKKKVKRKSGI